MILLWLPSISKLVSATVENHVQIIEPKCPACGYCMRSLHQARCPKCGETHLIEELFTCA